MRLASVRCLSAGNGLVQTNSALYSLYFLRGNDPKRLSLRHSQDVSSIVSRHNFKTSAMLYDTKEVESKVKAWREKLPWIKMHYAIKSNPSQPILRDLYAKGTGYDCASRTELETVLSLGASRKDIVYSNTIKDENDLAWAEHKQIPLTTADTIDELHKIKRLAPSMGILWRIAIQEEADDNLATPFSGKFGDDLEKSTDIH